jgi:tRNA nucleotidyltransferase (CCA-adding enzyme)
MRTREASTALAHITHQVLATHAKEKVNVPSDKAKQRREQVNHLRTRLETHIAAHPDYDLVKLRSSGSTAKHTAIRGGGSDADVAAYVRASAVGGVSAPEAGLLEWLKERCQEVYGATKVAEHFKISDHAVGIQMIGTGLKIDVAPVLYEGLTNDQGHLVTRQGTRVLTSVTQHLNFINSRASVAGSGYKELIRLLKAWIRHSKYEDDDFRCKSFLIELVVAHLWDVGWNGENLAITNYPRAFEQVLAYVSATGMSTPIVFTDYYEATAVSSCYDPIQVWDPVNPSNNVAGSYTDTDRKRLVERAAESLDAIVWAAQAPTKSIANESWRRLLGPTFGGA